MTLTTIYMIAVFAVFTCSLIIYAWIAGYGRTRLVNVERLVYKEETPEPTKPGIFDQIRSFTKRPTQTVDNVNGEDGEITETDAEIATRIQDRFSILGYLAEQVINNELRSLIIAGPPGLGKSYTLDQALLEHDPEKERHTVIKGYIRPTGLYKMLYERRNEGDILVFDDADSVFNDETSLNLLKAVLDTTEVREVSYMSERRLKDDTTGEMIPKTFEFKGTVVFITNLDFDGIIEKGHKLAPHFDAMLSRSHYIDMEMHTEQDYIVRIKQVIDLGMLKDRGLKPHEIADVIQFIEDNASKLRKLSLREAIKIADLRKSGKSNWKKVAKATTCKK